MKKALRQYRQSFKSKLVINVATLVASSILVVSVISYYQVRTSIRTSASDHLTSILQGKKAAIETHFKHVTEQLVSFAANPAMADASKEFAGAFAQVRTDSSGLVPYHIALGSMKQFYINEFLPELAKNSFYRTNTNYFPADSVTHILQHSYISENPNPYGSKQNLDAAMDGTTYSSVHAKYHPMIRKYMENFGFQDISIIDPNTGFVVYSTRKEVDFATNLFTGPFAKTNVAKAFDMARSLPEGRWSLVDFSNYVPSMGAPASFIATPVYDRSAMVGVVVFRLGIDEINNKMTGNQQWKRDGLGETGESYLLGPDSRMRSDARKLIEDKFHYATQLEAAGVPVEIVNNIKSLNTSILMQQLDTDVTRELLGGLSGEKILKYNGEERLAVFAPLSIPQMKWGVITEISTSEAFHTIATFEYEMIIAALSILIICLGCASWFARKFTRPVTTIEQTLTQLTMGGFPENIPVTAEDELGRTSKALNKLVTRVKSASSFAAAIGQGDLNAAYDSGDGDDVLSQALRSMRDNLKSHADKDARHDWVVEGLARFGEMIRNNANDMRRLADQVLTGIIRYIDANQGAIYFKESDGDQLHRLRRIATFAWGKQKFESELLERGEGLVGQCMLEGHKIILTDVPSNFVKITSGLGLSTPRWVGIFPLSIEGEVVGVLEIASMEVMQSHQVELIEKLCSSVALSVHHSQVNEQTRNLLQTSKAISEDLKVQEEELRQSQEELSATQEDLQRRLDAALLENKQLKEELGSMKKTKTFSVPAQFGKGSGKQLNGTFADTGFVKL